MTILDKAKKLAKENKKKKQEAIENETARDKFLNEELAKMENLLIKELEKINGQKSKYGKFKLIKKKDPRFSIIAELEVNGKLVAWFKAKIISGTYDGSDDCRDIPYTSATIHASFYKPDHLGNYIGRISEYGYENDEGQIISCYNVDNMPVFFEKMAERLANWM